MFRFFFLILRLLEVLVPKAQCFTTACLHARTHCVGFSCADLVDRVRREIELHRDLLHNHIVQLHHYFEDETAVYLVLELAHYGNIQRYIEESLRRQLTLVETRQYFYQVCNFSITLCFAAQLTQHSNQHTPNTQNTFKAPHTHPTPHTPQQIRARKQRPNKRKCATLPVS